MESDWNKIWQSDINRILTVGPSVRSRLRLVQRLIGQYHRTGQAVLDIGCGSGELLAALSGDDSFSRLVGVDLSGAALDQARRRCLRCDFQTLDIEREKLDGHFDIITSMATLEVINDDQKAIGNMAAMLKANGYLILAVQHRRKYWGKLDELRNYRRYEITDLVRLGSSCGLTLDNSFSWGWPLYHFFYRLMSLAGDRYLKGDLKIGFWDRLGAGILYYIFFVDDLFVPLGRGRWLFVVFRKNSSARTKTLAWTGVPSGAELDHG